MLKKLFKSNSRIYLDYASVTPIDPRVAKEVSKYSSSKYANPSSLYAEGVFAKKVLVEARKKVAEHIHAHPDEIIFTSGGTEANSLALEGVVRAAYDGGITKPHIIISAIEHSSIIEIAKMMEKHGCEVTRLPVNEVGIVSPEEIKESIKDNTALISIMTVNNEIGSIQPIREIAKIIRQTKNRKRKAESKGREDSDSFKYPLFHTDAAQAALYEDLFVEKLGVDLLTLDGSKIYGPRGVGCLYVKRGTPIQPIIYGGGQEAGMRSGTENIPSIMGFAKALEIAEGVKSNKQVLRSRINRFMPSLDRRRTGWKTAEVERLGGLRILMLKGLKKIRPDITVNGGDAGGVERVDTSPHILNVFIPGIDNEFFVFQLDARGIACSIKSSCLRDADESYVLNAIGANSKNSIRFSFGRWTDERDIRRVLRIIGEIIG